METAKTHYTFASGYPEPVNRVGSVVSAISERDSFIKGILSDFSAKAEEIESNVFIANLSLIALLSILISGILNLILSIS